MLHEWSYGMVSIGLVCFFLLFKVDAPYGKFSPGKNSIWGPLINAQFSWFIQESPSIVMALLFLFVWGGKQHLDNQANSFFAYLYAFHYIVRSWIFPFFIRGGKPSPLSVVLSAFFFCTVNGFLQCGYLLLHGPLYPKDYLTSWNVQLGLALFIAGWIINQHSDHILRNLRKPGETEYKIPRGGMFEYTSVANYTGEIIEWGGFALCCWSIPSFAFFLFTCFNLIPRALSYHRWYLQKFNNYPKDRKAVIPFLL